MVSAVSLARRLQDPLSELVKIEPKHLGVGMYQHDVPEKQLTSTLNEVIFDRKPLILTHSRKERKKKTSSVEKLLQIISQIYFNLKFYRLEISLSSTHSILS